MIAFDAIDHVQLAMPPSLEDRARAFYCGILGMTELAKPPDLAGRGGCWFASGAVQIHPGVEADFRPARKAHPGLRCTDYDALLVHLSARYRRLRRRSAFAAPMSTIRSTTGLRPPSPTTES